MASSTEARKQFSLLAECLSSRRGAEKETLRPPRLCKRNKNMIRTVRDAGKNINTQV